MARATRAKSEEEVVIHTGPTFREIDAQFTPSTICDIVQFLGDRNQLSVKTDGSSLPSYRDQAASDLLAGLLYALDDAAEGSSVHCHISQHGTRLEFFWGRSPVSDAAIDSLNVSYQRGRAESNIEETSKAPSALKAGHILGQVGGTVRTEKIEQSDYHVKTTVDLPPRP